MQEEEGTEDSDFGEEIPEEDADSQGDSQGDDSLPPPTRNVLLQARPHVFAVFELITLVGVAAYAYWSPRPQSGALLLSCSSLDCYNLQAELHQSMDLGAEPCDDFYQYVCGHWPEAHPRFEDQFRYMEARVYWAANDKLRERQSMYLDPSRKLTAFDKAALSYVACAEVVYRGIDAPWLIDSALFIGKGEQGHFLAASGSENATAEVLATLISFAMDYDLDVLFELVLAPEARSDNRSLLSVGHSISLISWKRHRERYLTPESTARCVRRFISAMSCDCALGPELTAALVAMDVQVTTKMAAAASMSYKRGAHFRFRDLPSTHAAVWLNAIRDDLLSAVRDNGDDEEDVAERKSNTVGVTAPESIRGLSLLWNLTEDSELYAADPKIFGLVDEMLALHPESHVRYYVAFLVVRALAPYVSHRLTESLFSDDNVTAVYLYAADACAAAASKITSFALASFIFQDVLSERRVRMAYDQVDLLRNETMASLSWLEESAQESANQRLAALRSLVAWPQQLNSSDSTDAYFASLPDFRGYYVEIYLDSVAALRRRDKARLLLAATPADNAATLSVEAVPFEGFRTAVRYSVWLDSLFVSPGALFEPILFATGDNQPTSAGGDRSNNSSAPSAMETALALAGLGHLVAHELWHAAIGEHTVGASPKPDVLLSGPRLRRHACLTNVYNAAAVFRVEKDADSQKLDIAASENLADVTGLQVAYAAYRASADGSSARNESGAENATDAFDSWISRVTGFRERELFFIASCFKWCAAVADQVVRSSLGFTPARLRCNVPVALTSGFGDTFGCKKEHRMSQIAANYTCASPGETINSVAGSFEDDSAATSEATEATTRSLN